MRHLCSLPYLILRRLSRPCGTVLSCKAPCGAIQFLLLLLYIPGRPLRLSERPYMDGHCSTLAQAPEWRGDSHDLRGAARPCPGYAPSIPPASPIPKTYVPWCVPTRKPRPRSSIPMRAIIGQYLGDGLLVYFAYPQGPPHTGQPNLLHDMSSLEADRNRSFTRIASHGSSGTDHSLNCEPRKMGNKASQTACLADGR